ncbi:MAG: hypothetical protein H0T78_09925 [Longispora sp.]|nr:hypothetical protein [Longispora sp. (in: high G+C Gram-positive bacteria)]
MPRRRNGTGTLKALIQELANRHPWLSIVPALSGPNSAPGCEHGTAAEVAARNGPWEDHDFFISGTPEMVRGSLHTLNRLHIPTQQVRYYSFVDVDLR